MTIAADLQLSRYAGAFALGMALLQFALGFFLFQKALAVSLAAGLLFLVLSAACFSYRNVAHFDPETDVLEKHRGVLFLERNQGFLLSSFNSVGISAVSTKGLQSTILAHFVELRGRTRVSLPGMYLGAGQARVKAAEVAAFLNVPLDSHIRRIFVER